MALRIVRLGTPRHKGEGLRIGTVRRPPRGVPKAEFARRDFYDVWLPLLSPSPELVKLAMSGEHWATFVRTFRAEMNQSDAKQALDLLAALSHTADISIGCYCENEDHCHRSVLRALLTDRGAKIAR